MKNIKNLYALEISGFSCLNDLERLVANELGITPEELANKYQEIADKINEKHDYKSDLEFRVRLYAEYCKLLGITECL